jgi:hypothetical protein
MGNVWLIEPVSNTDKELETDVPTPQVPLPGKFMHEKGPQYQTCHVDAESFKQPQALFRAKNDAICRLKALIDEYTTDATITIHPSSVSTAESFLKTLPGGISLPEFSVEPDGSISMDWIAAPNRVFSISVGAHNRFACAYIDGTNEGHFVENFDGQKIPKRIIDGITAIVTN